MTSKKRLLSMILVLVMMFSLISYAAIPRAAAEGIETGEGSSEPSVEPAPEPEPEPSAEPTNEPEPKPTVEPTDEPEPEPSIEATEEPAPESTAEPTEEPTHAPEMGQAYAPVSPINETRGTTTGYEEISGYQVTIDNAWSDTNTVTNPTYQFRFGERGSPNLPAITCHAITKGGVTTPVFCVQPNKAANDDNPHTMYDDLSSFSVWSTMTANQKQLLKLALACGYPNTTDSGISENDQWAATQTMVFDIIVGFVRYDGSSIIKAAKSSGGANFIDEDWAGREVQGAAWTSITDGLQGNPTGVKTAHANILSRMQNALLSEIGQPNFGLITLNYDSASGNYTGTATASNGNAAYYNFAYNSGGVTVTQSGNTVTVTMTPAAAANYSTASYLPEVTSTVGYYDLADGNYCGYSSASSSTSYQSFLGINGTNPINYSKAKLQVKANINGKINILKNSADASLLNGVRPNMLDNPDWDRTLTSFSTLTAGNTTIRVTDSVYLRNGTLTKASDHVNLRTTSDDNYKILSLGGHTALTAGTTYTLSLYAKVNSVNGTAALRPAKTSGTGFGASGNPYYFKASDVGEYKLYTVTFTAPENAAVPYGEILVYSNAGYALDIDIQAWKLEEGSTSTLSEYRFNAVYGIYRDEACTDLYTSGVLSDFGTYGSRVFSIPYGTYYVKEITAPEGFALDPTVYPVTVDESHTTVTVTSSEPPAAKYFSLQKRSANTDMTDGNRCYDLEGAQYGVYKTRADALADNNRIETLTTDANGNATTTRKYNLGKWYIRELVASPGYMLDSQEHEVIVTAVEADNVFTVTEEPGKDPNKIQIRKISSSGAVVRTITSGYAVFKVEFFGNQDWTGLPLRTWYYKTINGIAKLGDEAYLDTSKVNSDRWYDGGLVSYPLGSIKITEEQAPAGYIGTDLVWLAQVTQDSPGADGTWHWVTPEGGLVSYTADGPTLENEHRNGTLEVLKLDHQGNALPGVTFRLEYSTDDGTTWARTYKIDPDALTDYGACKSAELVDGELTTGADGKVIFEGLMADGEILYRLTEVKAPEGFTLLKDPVYEGTLPVPVDRDDLPDSEEIDGHFYCYTLTCRVTDTSQFVLPVTGGSGFVFLSLAMAAAALGMALILADGRKKLQE